MRGFDLIVVGASFAGVAVARSAAASGLSVALLERKADPGAGLNTTGILVEEAAELLNPPAHLLRKITRVKLYAPSLSAVTIAARRYFFLATDTPALMRHAVDEAECAGAAVFRDTAFLNAEERADGLVHVNDGAFSARMVVGADGPRSKVARAFGLSVNTRFLLGAEAEFRDFDLEDPEAFHCFLDARAARGYLGWAIPGVGVTQVGLAAAMPDKPDIQAFLARVAPALGTAAPRPIAHRGGLIPVGGILPRTYAERAILIGDAAGTVSPLTAGGIHNAIYYGRYLGALIADHLREDGPHPGPLLAAAYPDFRLKLLLRAIYERTPNWALDAMLTAPGFMPVARRVFFLKKRLPVRRARRDLIAPRGVTLPRNDAQSGARQTLE